MAKKETKEEVQKVAVVAKKKVPKATKKDTPKKKAKEDNNSLPLTKEECALFLGLIAESSIKIKDIQYL